MAPKWKLPPPRELGWRLRRVEDAKSSDVRLADGRRELRIKHEVLRGITPAAMSWWFQSFDRPCQFGGASYPQMYLLWHPYDHHSVSITRDAAGRVSPGQSIHIREAFGGARWARAPDQPPQPPSGRASTWYVALPLHVTTMWLPHRRTRRGCARSGQSAIITLPVV